jgi:hypothetical protein
MIQKLSQYIIILLIITLFMPHKAFGQAAEGSKNMIRVTPIFINMNLQKDTENTYELKIDNLLSIPLGVKTSLESLDPTDEENGIQFGPPKQNEPFISWISLSEKDFIIPENESKTISITVKPPRNSKDGGYYGILFLTPLVSKPLDKTSPTVVSRVGALMFANIGTPKPAKPGQKAKIEEFKFIDMFGKKTPQMVLRVKNTYPYLFSVKAKADIKQVLGQTRTINLEDKRILPGKIRKWTKPQDLGIGIYKASVAVSLGGGEIIYKSTYFLVLPIKQYSSLFIAFCLLLITYLGRKRFQKAFVILIKDKKPNSKTKSLLK